MATYLIQRDIILVLLKPYTHTHTRMYTNVARVQAGMTLQQIRIQIRPQSLFTHSLTDFVQKLKFQHL